MNVCVSPKFLCWNLNSNDDSRRWTFRRYLGHKERALINEIKVLKRGLRQFICHSHCVCVCSVTKSCLTLCNPMDCSMPGFPVLHCFLEFAQIHVHWVGDAKQPSHPVPSPSPSAFSNSQHQGLFQGLGSSQQSFAMELQLEYQSFQWIFSLNFF